MCTVSYLPQPGGGFILTSNRDETPRRNASEIHHKSQGDHLIIYPADPDAGGSWFAISDTGRVACLLNGGFRTFMPDPIRYPYSRGQILLGAMTGKMDEEVLFNKANLAKTSPFTLVLAEEGSLVEFVWDGSDLHPQALDPSQPGFWSSVTLYPEDVRKWRRELFDKWLAGNDRYHQELIMKFHRYGGEGDPWNGFVMNRQERVRTLSITSAQLDKDSLTMRHEDLMSGKIHHEELTVIPHDVATD